MLDLTFEKLAFVINFLHKLKVEIKGKKYFVQKYYLMIHNENSNVRMKGRLQSNKRHQFKTID